MNKFMFSVVLRSKQLGEVVYLVSGRGLAPSPMEPLSVSAASGSSTSLILPFRNPTDVPVLVDVTITDHEQTMNSISSSLIRCYTFCLRCAVINVLFEVLFSSKYKWQFLST